MQIFELLLNVYAYNAKDLWAIDVKNYLYMERGGYASL